MYASGIAGAKGFLGANFKGNVALFGGGLAVEDCISFPIGVDNAFGTLFFRVRENCFFLGNVAHRGGGLYVKSGNNRLENYQVIRALLDESVAKLLS